MFAISSIEIMESEARGTKIFNRPMKSLVECTGLALTVDDKAESRKIIRKIISMCDTMFLTLKTLRKNSKNSYKRKKFELLFLLLPHSYK